MGEIYRDADYLSLPVPDGRVKGDPVRIGGLNGVLATNRTPDAQPAFTDTQGPNTPGGNPAGHASVWLKGGHEFTVAFAVASVGLPIYIVTATNALSATDASGANPLYGHALTTKSAPSGPLTVRLAN